MEKLTADRFGWTGILHQTGAVKISLPLACCIYLQDRFNIKYMPVSVSKGVL